MVCKYQVGNAQLRSVIWVERRSFGLPVVVREPASLVCKLQVIVLTKGDSVASLCGQDRIMRNHFCKG